LRAQKRWTYSRWI